MNNDPSHPHADSGPPHDPVSADEARVLAVLLGEASPYETESVAELLASRPDLRAYHDRTAALLGIVVDAAKPEPVSPALRLDESRRATLLEKLRESAAAASVSDTTIQFPSGGSAQRGRLIGFFRVALVSSRRYAALLAVLLLLAVGLSTTVSLGTRSSRRAESEPVAKSADSFAVGAGAGAADEKAEQFEQKNGEVRGRLGYTAPGEVTLQGATGNRTLDSAFGRQNTPSRIISKSAASSVGDSRKEYDGTPVAAPVPAPVTAPSAPEPQGRLFAKSGKGELTLSGTNNYTGSTTITAGTLAADAAARESGATGYEGKPTDEGRIVSRSATATTSLPQSESEVPGKKLGGFASTLSAGGMAKGEAGDSGGGEGSGIAVGRGGSANYFKADKDAEASGGRRDIADKVPVLGDIPLVGKLFVTNGKDGKATVGESTDYSDKQSAADRLLNKAQEQALYGDQLGALESYKDALQYDPSNQEAKKQSIRLREAIHAESGRYAGDVSKAKLLEEVDMKWANPEVFAKSLEKEKGKVAAPLPAKKPSRAVIAQTETQAADNAFSTFSLNVSDVSFRLAAEAAKRGAYPDTGGIRSEEFVNAQRYRDPAPRAEEPVALTQEQARHPFAHNRNLVRLSLKTNAEGRSAQQPLSLVVLLDNSGSMERSDRRETAAAAVNTLAANVRPGDKVSVIGFARNTRLLVDRMDGANTKPLRDLANNPPPTEGGTNMENALNKAYAQLTRQTPAGVPGRVVLLTDGAANLGDADPARLASMVESNRLRGQALDAYGVGFDGYDDGMLERLSRKGDGRYAFLNNAADAGAELGQKLAGALRPFANDVKVQVEFNPSRVSSWRLLGYDNHRLRKQDFRDNTVDAAELAAAEAGTALYAFEPKADGVGDVGVVRVRYRVPGTQDYREREWPIPYEAPPAFNDAPEGVRLAGCAAFVAEAFANNPNAATTDRAELRKQVSRLASQRTGDKPLSDLRILADKLASEK